MKKYLIRGGILLAIFIISLIFFYNTVEEHSSSAEVTTVENVEASLPVISFLVNDNEINQIKGYTVSQVENYPRDSITPVSTAKNFSILIKEKGCDVKALAVNVMELPGCNEISSFETNNISTADDGRLKVNVTIDETLTEDAEYLMCVTLTTSLGDKVYYYTRLQVAGYGSLTQSLLFVNNFHDTAFDKTKVAELDDVMESTDTEITDYSHIDITANADALSYGNMNPTEVYCQVPTITEYNQEYVSATLRYWIEVFTEDGQETIECKEDFRFQYSSYKTFLFNYDRTMETLFDGDHFTIGKNEMKLGISESGDVDRIYDEEKTQMMFSYQGTLWHLDMNENRLVKVHTYKDDDFDRRTEEDYNYELLSIDQDGNADFAVYGYIGKGVYEGRTGIIYYHYYSGEKRIEEKMFIPVNVEYNELIGEFGEVSYTSKFDVFYFTLFDSYYAYELETNVFKTLVEDLGENWIYFEDKNVLCYNENPDATDNKRIVIHDVTELKNSYIEADDGCVIKLLGTVDDRIVYGNGMSEHVSFYADGETMLPLVKISIAETDTTLVKDYVPEAGSYIGEVVINTEAIDMSLYSFVSAAEGDSKACFEYKDKDVIINLNSSDGVTKAYSGITNSVTGLEYYVTLPTSYMPEKNPDKSEAMFTVIKTDTSATVDTEPSAKYHVLAYGEILLTTDSLGEALVCADDNYGTVINSEGMPIWRRGLVSEKVTLEGITVSHVNDSRTAEQAVLQMLMDYEGIEADAKTFNMKARSMYEWFREAMGEGTAMVEGASLSQVLYFVSDGHPVIAPANDGYVVITGFTKDNVIYLDPVTGNKVTKAKSKAEELFKAAGGVYYVY